MGKKRGGVVQVTKMAADDPAKLLQIQNMISSMSGGGKPPGGDDLRGRLRQRLAMAKQQRLGKHAKRSIVDTKEDEINAREKEIRDSIAKREREKQEKELTIKTTLDLLEKRIGQVKFDTYAACLAKGRTGMNDLVCQLYERQSSISSEICWDDEAF